MGIYLDNAVSNKDTRTRTSAGSCSSCTPSARGNYTEGDVKSSARILTGWRVDVWETWAATYDTEAHWAGHVKVGFSHQNRKADGREVTRDYLRYLAHHPATAHRIADRLATNFVRDDPPQSLVEPARQGLPRPRHRRSARSCGRWSTPRSSGTPRASKIRDPQRGPGRDVPRARRRREQPPADETPRAHAMLWQAAGIGAVPSWPRPDGQPIDSDVLGLARRGCSARCRSLGDAGGWWPTQGIHYREPALVAARDTDPLRRARRPPVTATSCTGTRPHAPQGLLPGRELPSRWTQIDKDHAAGALGVPAAADHPPRLPRPLHPVTS